MNQAEFIQLMDHTVAVMNTEVATGVDAVILIQKCLKKPY